MRRRHLLLSQAIGVLGLLGAVAALGGCPRPDPPPPDGAGGDHGGVCSGRDTCPPRDADPAPDGPTADTLARPDSGPQADSKVPPDIVFKPDAPLPDAPLPDVNKPDASKPPKLDAPGPDTGGPDAAVGSLEVCDGKDNDLDGKIDEDFPWKDGPCITSGLGVCGPGTLACGLTGSLKGKLYCKPKVSNGSAEKCDGLDNNCNGAVDEKLSTACYTGTTATRNVGSCKDGVKVCTGGAWTACLGEVKPTTEFCGDKLDNDCDGTADEKTQCPVPCLTIPLDVHKMTKKVKGTQAGTSPPTPTCDAKQHKVGGKTVNYLQMKFTNYAKGWVICHTDPSVNPVDMTPLEKDQAVLVVTLRVNGTLPLNGYLNFWYVNQNSSCEKYVILAKAATSNALSPGTYEMGFLKAGTTKRNWSATCDAGSTMIKSRIQLVSEWTDSPKYWSPSQPYADPVKGDVDLLSVKLYPKDCLCSSHTECHSLTPYCCPVKFGTTTKGICKSSCSVP